MSSIINRAALDRFLGNATAEQARKMAGHLRDMADAVDGGADELDGAAKRRASTPAGRPVRRKPTRKPAGKTSSRQLPAVPDPPARDAHGRRIPDDGDDAGVAAKQRANGATRDAHGRRVPTDEPAAAAKQRVPTRDAFGRRIR